MTSLLFPQRYRSYVKKPGRGPLLLMFHDKTSLDFTPFSQEEQLSKFSMYRPYTGLLRSGDHKQSLAS